jgi:2-hydroxychromene-2-carboxylate isomerase
MPRLDIYWSFRSPYSWLAIDRLARIRSEYRIETHFRPVRPLAMREPQFFERNRPQFLPYLMRDVFRESQRLGIPIAPPRPDPISMDLASGRVDPAQPLMERLMALAVAACRADRGIEFARAVAARIWGGVENWHQAAVMAEATAAAGLRLDDLDRWAADHAEEIRAEIAASETEQMKHHWGVPLMVLDDEPFFGQDRLDALVWRLDQLQLRRP